jgi:hypothetical protein
VDVKTSSWLRKRTTVESTSLLGALLGAVEKREYKKEMSRIVQWDIHRLCAIATAKDLQKDGVNVGENTTGRNGDAAKELVQLLVVLDSKSDVARHDTTLLVITGGIASELEDFGAKVFQDGGEIHRGSGSHASGVLSITEVTANTTNGELQASLGGGGRRLLFSASSLSFSFAGHVDEF